MREFVKAGEVAAVLGLDSRTSPWAVWNRMTEDEDEATVGDRSRWQGRLASDIAAGIAKDHGLKLGKALEAVVSAGIMPPRAWEVGPSARTEGKPAVLIVQQRTQQSMFGWSAPSSVPDKQAIRLFATAIAYGYEHVYFGVLIDGYRSELYCLAVGPERRDEIIKAVAEMIRMVREDDEPVVDYDLDRSAIREGKAAVKGETSSDKVNALIEEREDKLAQVKSLKNQIRPLEKRAEEIESMIIHMLANGQKLDTGKHIIGVEEDSRGKKKLQVANKEANPASLF